MGKVWQHELLCLEPVRCFRLDFVGMGEPARSTSPCATSVTPPGNSSFTAATTWAGLANQEENEEKVHEIVVRLLVHPGGLFRDYNERQHGPFPLRFKRALGNTLKNLTEKERNRRRFIPSIPIHQEFIPGGVTSDDLVARGAPEGDPEVTEGFREMVRRHLGQQALSIFDARLQGVEMKELPISPYNTKKLVQGIKDLARRYAVAVGDRDLLAHIERLMASEEKTVQRRQATMKRRAGVAAG